MKARGNSVVQKKVQPQFKRNNTASSYETNKKLVQGIVRKQYLDVRPNSPNLTAAKSRPQTGITTSRKDEKLNLECRPDVIKFCNEYLDKFDFVRESNDGLQLDLMTAS